MLRAVGSLSELALPLIAGEAWVSNDTSCGTITDEEHIASTRSTSARQLSSLAAERTLGNPGRFGLSSDWYVASLLGKLGQLKIGRAHV